MSHLSVAKFGGTSVANHAAMTACAKIVIADPNTRVVVLSASAGVTNLLVALANGVEATEREKLIDEIRQIQENILNELKDDSRVRPIIEKYLENITSLSEAASLATSPALTDELISHGEMMSTQIFIEILREQNASGTWVDVRTIVSTNNHFGKAAPNDEQTQSNSDSILKPLIDRGELVITQGFIGREPSGKTTTLGRGGSDYSAALLAEVLNAKDVLIWTDVAGIYTTDPRIVPAAQRIDTMSFAEAASLATSPALTDELISHGEMMSSQIFIEILREQNASGTWVDVRTIVATNNHFGKAAPNDEQTQSNSGSILKPLIDRGELVITQGFIGREPSGKTTTLGRGGSDYSAALLAEVLNAKDVLIWTDVAGIYTTDPRIVPTAQRIDTMSFAEAAEMATFGAKVLHPATLLPAVRSNIPVYVGSSKAPEAGGTWVTRDPQPRPTFRAIALRRDQTLLTLSSLSMLHAQGFLANVFNILAKHKISVDTITTSEVSVALTLDKTGSASSGAELLSTELLDELRQYCSVKVDTGLSLVALIGNDLHTATGVAKGIFDTLEPYNVRMISYGASTNNICMLVQSEHADEVVRSLHKSLFE